MTPEFEKENVEMLDEAEFDIRINSRDYQPQRWLAEAIPEAAKHIGGGIAWFGFWIGLGIALASFKLFS